ncbi:MAG TPA: SPOR domain-containing protein [Xanthobacteraceae bacterium]|nr:SPOR domain-containing protein [Xanthobacteraceae bacterium]
MADNNFRSYRGRDPLVRSANSPADEAADPLAELARMIGQTDPHSERGRYENDAAAYGRDWPADEGYADQRDRVEDRYVQPPLSPAAADPHFSPPQRGGHENEPAPAARYFSGPAAKFGGFREDGGDYEAVDDARHRHEPATDSVGPAFAAAPGDYGYEADQPEHDDGQAYGADDDYDDAAPSRRRGGLVVVMAVLGLAVIGSASAFGYRAMFGGSMLPTLPPIIKASNGPNKIIPNHADARANGQAGGASTGSTENLVSREEQPVKIEPPKAPQVVAAAPPPPEQSPAQAAPGPPPAPVALLSEPKKVHTVTIRADQPNGVAAAVSPSQTARGAARQPSAGPKPTMTASVSAAPNAPLSIVPGAGGGASAAAAPARARASGAPEAGAPLMVASATPATAGAAHSSAGSGYAVQLASQGSEADAQAAYRALQAKFPDQLGGREPILRRADLGAKGVFYRALVGPFASREEAAGMCSSLKAAGGNCVVLRN